MNADQQARALVAEAALAVDPRAQALLLAQAVCRSFRSVEGDLGRDLGTALSALDGQPDEVCRFVWLAGGGLVAFRRFEPQARSRMLAATRSYNASLAAHPECVELMLLATIGTYEPERAGDLAAEPLRSGTLTPSTASQVLTLAGAGDAWAGFLVRGETMLAEAVTLAAVAGEVEVEGQASALLAKVLAFRGDLAGADAALARARRLAADSGSDYVAHGVVECAVAVEFVRGDASAWRGLLDLLVTEGGGAVSGLASEYTLELATALLLEGDAAGRALAEALPDPPDEVPGSVVARSWRRWLLDMDDPDAQADLARATHLSSQPSAWTLRARAAWLLSDHLSHGEAAQARTLVELAARTYTAAGASGLLDALARRTPHLLGVSESEHLRLPPARGEPDLTTSERVVADALREGLSNREIADRAHVSVKTVEFHLSNIYRKLGVRGRTELVVRLTGE